MATDKILGYAVIDYPQIIAAIYKTRNRAQNLAQKLLTTATYIDDNIRVIAIHEYMLNGDSGVLKNAAWMMQDGHWGVQPSYQGI